MKMCVIHGPWESMGVNRLQPMQKLGWHQPGSGFLLGELQSGRTTSMMKMDSNLVQTSTEESFQCTHRSTQQRGCFGCRDKCLVQSNVHRGSAGSKNILLCMYIYNEYSYVICVCIYKINI